MKNKIVILSFSLFAIVIFLLVIYSSFNKKVESKVNAVNYNDAREKLSYMIPFCQSEDGGFHKINNIQTDKYLALYSTYNIYSIINRAEGQIKEEKREELYFFLSRFDTLDSLLLSETYDDISLIYYYTQLCGFIDYDIPPRLKNEIEKHVGNLQSEYGYYYRSEKEREDYLNKKITDSPHDPIRLISSFRAIQILHNTGMINFDTLSDFFNHEILNIDWVTYRNKDLMAVSCIVLCNQIIHDIDYIDVPTASKYLNGWIQHINEESIEVDINLLSDLAILYNFVKTDDLTETQDFLIELYSACRKKWLNQNDTTIDLSASVVMYGVLFEIEKLLKFENDKVLYDFVNDFILSLDHYKSYDNSYFMDEQESEIMYTYYALEILSSMNLENILSDKIDEYLLNEIQYIKSDSELKYLFALKLASLRKIEINNVSVLDYLENQCTKMSSVNYNQNLDQIYLLLSVLEDFPQVHLEDANKLNEVMNSIIFELNRNDVINLFNLKEVEDIAENFLYYMVSQAYIIKYYLDDPASKSDAITFINEFSNFTQVIPQSKSSLNEHVSYLTIMTTWYITNIIRHYDIAPNELELADLNRKYENAIYQQRDRILFLNPYSGKTSWEVMYYAVSPLIYFQESYST